MECFDLSVLSAYLDDGLDTLTSEAIAEHVQTCQHCTDRLQTLQEHAALLASLVPERQMPRLVCPERYSAETLSAYVQHTLTAPEGRQVEQHLRDCQACRGEVMELHRTLRLMAQAPLLAPPAELVTWVAQAWQPPQVHTLGALVIQMTQQGLRFLEAMLLPADVQVSVSGQPVPEAAFRSGAGDTPAVGHLDIRQHRGALALALSLHQAANATVLCTIRLHKQGAPLARRQVLLSDTERRIYAGSTSASGEIVDVPLGPGEYTLRIPQEQVETQFILQAAL